MAAVNGEVATAYEQAAEGWAAGAARVYGALAEGVAARAPDVEGRRVLDIGAGTGVLGEALLRRGAAKMVAVDLAPGMLARADARAKAVVGDATALPFADSSFDLAATAFCLSHLPDPLAGLREARRVAPVLLSGSFDDAWTHPAKAAVDEVLQRAGYRPPDWYAVLKRAGQLDSRPALMRLAREAGYSQAEVVRVEVDTGVRSPADLADWRLGMAQVAAFVGSLAPATRRGVRDRVEHALQDMPPLVVPVLVLTAA
jgi:ubiquinone/menaquinone biosynthesis C-methylase UbiE